MAARKSLTKAKETPRLHFANPRLVMGADVSAPRWKEQAWAPETALSPVDVRQLEECILALYAPTLTARELFGRPMGDVFKGPLQGFQECPLEWWDVVDDAGHPRYQLWLWFADTGLLIDAGTVNRVAPINECNFNGTDGALDEAAAARLGAALDEAQSRVRNAPACSHLASIAFRESPK